MYVSEFEIAPYIIELRFFYLNNLTPRSIHHAPPGRLCPHSHLTPHSSTMPPQAVYAHAHTSPLTPSTAPPWAIYAHTHTVGCAIRTLCTGVHTPCPLSPRWHPSPPHPLNRPHSCPCHLHLWWLAVLWQWSFVVHHHGWSSLCVCLSHPQQWCRPKMRQHSGNNQVMGRGC